MNAKWLILAAVLAAESTGKSQRIAELDEEIQQATQDSEYRTLAEADRAADIQTQINELEQEQAALQAHAEVRPETLAREQAAQTDSTHQETSLSQEMLSGLRDQIRDQELTVMRRQRTVTWTITPADSDLGIQVRRDLAQAQQELEALRQQYQDVISQQNQNIQASADQQAAAIRAQEDEQLDTQLALQQNQQEIEDLKQELQRQTQQKAERTAEITQLKEERQTLASEMEANKRSSIGSPPLSN